MKATLLTLTLCAAGAVSLFADTMPDTSKDLSKDLDKEIQAVEEIKPLFTENRITFQFLTGGMTNEVGIGPDVGDFNYTQTEARLGWMLNDVTDWGAFSGNVEVLLSLTNSWIFDGPGNYMGGLTALIRYNFVQPNWKIVPYIQGGAGFVLTDAYTDRTQNAIGQVFEFTEVASIGFRYLVCEKWSVDVEGTYQHISNAGMADRNKGVNSLGGTVGFTYFFDKTWE